MKLSQKRYRKMAKACLYHLYILGLNHIVTLFMIFFLKELKTKVLGVEPLTQLWLKDNLSMGHALNCEHYRII